MLFFVLATATFSQRTVIEEADKDYAGSEGTNKKEEHYPSGGFILIWFSMGYFITR